MLDYKATIPKSLTHTCSIWAYNTSSSTWCYSSTLFKTLHADLKKAFTSMFPFHQVEINCRGSIASHNQQTDKHLVGTQLELQYLKNLLLIENNSNFLQDKRSHSSDCIKTLYLSFSFTVHHDLGKRFFTFSDT